MTIKSQLSTDLLGKYHTAFVGIGSNLYDPKQQIEKALKALARLSLNDTMQKSSLYLSQPMGPQNQDGFINAVAKIFTPLSPISLLDELQAIENTQGRTRKIEQWGPRTLDLDLILYDNLIINEPRLTVPHYGIKKRSFVLIPLAEIEPKIKLPDESLVSDLIKQVGHQGIRKL